MTEQQTRYDIYKFVTEIRHGDIHSTVVEFTRQLNQDPAFMVPFAVWLQENHSIRDTVHAAIASCVFYRSNDSQLQDWVRNVGLGLLSRLPVYQVKKVLEYGLKLGTLPRSVKTEVGYYLRKLEAEPNWDKIAVGNRNDLTWLYSRTYTRYGDLAQACLVDGSPPANTAFWAIQQAPRVVDVYDRAKLLVEHGVPYPVMTTFLSPKDPVALMALVEAMTPQQLANNLAMLQRAGLNDNAEVAEYVRQKLAQGARRGKVNVGRLGVAADKVTTPVAEQALEQAVSQYKIVRNTALFIDKSSSMHTAMDLLRNIGPYIAKAADAGGAAVDYIVFNDRGQRLDLRDTSLRGFQAALVPHRASGSTSFGQPINMLKDVFEQFVYLTDQQETCRPSFTEGYRRYVSLYNTKPDVVVIHLRGDDRDIERQCREMNVKCDVWQFTGDYNQVTPILQMLSGKSFYDIINDILAIELPMRLTPQS